MFKYINIAVQKDDADLRFNYGVLQLLIDGHCSIGWHGPGRRCPDGQGCTQTALLELRGHLITCICSQAVLMLQIFTEKPSVAAQQTCIFVQL